MNNENNLNTNGDIKQSTIKAKDMIEHKDKFEYLEYEVGYRLIYSKNLFSIQIFFLATTI